MELGEIVFLCLLLLKASMVFEMLNTQVYVLENLCKIVKNILNLTGRIIAGWVSDYPFIDAMAITVMAVLVGGVTVITMPFLTTFGLLATACVVFGLCVAAFICLTSIVLVDLVGLDDLTSAFGLLNLFRLEMVYAFSRFISIYSRFGPSWIRRRDQSLAQYHNDHSATTINPPKLNQTFLLAHNYCCDHKLSFFSQIKLLAARLVEKYQTCIARNFHNLATHYQNKTLPIPSPSKGCLLNAWTSTGRICF